MGVVILNMIWVKFLADSKLHFILNASHAKNELWTYSSRVMTLQNGVLFCVNESELTVAGPITVTPFSWATLMSFLVL